MSCLYLRAGALTTSCVYFFKCAKAQNAGLSEPRGRGARGHESPQFLADQLTLLNQGGIIPTVFPGFSDLPTALMR